MTHFVPDCGNPFWIYPRSILSAECLPFFTVEIFFYTKFPCESWPIFLVVKIHLNARGFLKLFYGWNFYCAFFPGNAKFGFREYVFSSALSNWLLNLQWSWARLRSRTSRGCNLNIFSLPHFGQFQKALLFYNQFFYGSPFPVFKACRFRFLRATRISRFFRPFSPDVMLKDKR